MNNPIKKYFQKLYNETGKKPFTFFNAFLVVFLPLIIFFGLGSTMATSEMDIPKFLILGIVVGLGLDLILVLVKFKGKGIALFFLHILASLLFFCTFILWPLLKFMVRSGSAANQANLGNVSASVNASKRAGATKGKKSALNWFEYEGYTWKDEREVIPNNTNSYSADEGSYSYNQNQKAKAQGFSNGKDAEMSGRSWNGNDWV